jgi:hypothetical protein
MRRAIEAISIVCGVVAIVILAVAAMPFRSEHFGEHP